MRDDAHFVGLRASSVLYSCEISFMASNPFDVVFVLCSIQVVEILEVNSLLLEGSARAKVV